MKRNMIRTILVGAAIAAMLAPASAFAYDGALTTDGDAAMAERGSVSKTADEDEAARADADSASARQSVSSGSDTAEGDIAALCAEALNVAAGTVQDAADEEEARLAESESSEKILEYDPADIETIGTQESTGHTICCPSFSCAYADAVLDGTVHDHDYYTCSCCTWTDWGGGDSSYRCVGSDQDVLREAYDQIAAGRPTVVHVAYGYGEHWIALIGYTGVDDPDSLTLDNFIALDPWDGAQIIASERYTLYGDGCQHISDR